MAEIAAAARAAAQWPVTIHAEDHRNLATLIEAAEDGGWGLDGVWADDFHHVLRSRLAGDRHGYYRDYTGSLDELARTLRQGWLFTGQHSAHGNAARGTDPSRLPMHRFVVCLQNHDQIGNRATGDRLNHAIDAAAWRAASALLLTSPMTAAAVHGAGVGRIEPVPVLHRSRATARSARHRRAAARVRGFSGVHRSRGALAHPRSTGCGHVRAEQARLERARTARRTRSRWRSTPTCCDCGTRTARSVRRKRRRSRRRPSTTPRSPCGAKPAASGSWLSSGSRAPAPRASRTTSRQCPPCVLSTEDARYASDPAPIDVRADGRQMFNHLPAPRRGHTEVLNERDSSTPFPNA